MSEENKKQASEQDLSEEQLDTVAGGALNAYAPTPSTYKCEFPDIVISSVKKP